MGIGTRKVGGRKEEKGGRGWEGRRKKGGRRRMGRRKKEEEGGTKAEPHRYVYHLPMWVHKMNLVGMFLVEVFPIPFFLIWPNSELYKISVALIILLQVSEGRDERREKGEEKRRG
jgi:hypothetical protein